jgi:hypothetical protein
VNDLGAKKELASPHVNVAVDQLLETYPRQRPPLSPDHERVYAEQYRLNREGARPIENLAQRLERWMHKQVAETRGEPILELGAGTLNHRKYEGEAVVYDVVEPFRELYLGRPETENVRAFYDAVEDIPTNTRYRRIVSVAVLEHMENLPRDVAVAALRLEADGVFQAGIPSEGGFLWGIAWRLSTGISYYLRTGLDYGVVMRHEHINSAFEILAVVRYLFRDVGVRRFPLPWHHCSFYAYLDARNPYLERCRAIANATR